MRSTNQLQNGRIAFEGSLNSGILRAPRVVRIYLPPSYDAAPLRRFPVLYMQDGQNAFTTAGDQVAFGWGNWQLDKTVDELSSTGRMRETIIVAVDCSPERYLEYRGPAYPYTPAHLAALKRLPPAAGDDRAFVRYSQFLVEELKSRIDREYRTMPGPKNTALMGSSMGGLFSLALAWERPDVFGGAASLSGAFQVERRCFLLRVLRRYQGPPKPIRVYLDSGVIDYSGGDDGRKDTAAVARELRRIGWRDGVNLFHFVDEVIMEDDELVRHGLPPHKWAEARTSQHNEFYWRCRAWRALTFLFGAWRESA